MNRYTSPEVLEHNKKSDIYHINELDKLTNWENYLNHWEKFLSSDYWKSWQEKINSFQSQVALDFYVNRLLTLMNFVRNYSKKKISNGSVPNQRDVSKLVQREEQRLQNISPEDFKKEDKFSNNINWEDWGIENQKEFEATVLKNTKSGSISFIKDKDRLTTWGIYHAHWETYLACHDYWKNWRERINSFQTEKEVNFYKDRLRAFIDFVKEHTRKDTIRDIVRHESESLKDLYELISNELKRLENINEEEFNKTDKWRSSVKWRELSTEEVLNDPWFSEQINNIFGLESKGDIGINHRWEENKNALTTEINHLKAENNQEKLNKKIGQLEKIAKQLETDISQLKAEVQELKKGSNNALECDSHLAQKENELQVKQSRLEQLSSIINSNSNSNSNSLPSSLAIGGVALTIIGLVSFLVIKKHQKNK